MADDNIKVGGVVLEITLDDSHINQDAEKAAKKTRKKFSGELAGAGAEADKAFKKSFTGVTGSGSAAAKKIRQSFSSDMRAAGKDVEKSLRQSFDNVGSAGGSIAESLVGGLKRAGAAALAMFSVQKLKEFGQSAIEQAAHVSALDSQLTQTFREYESAAVSAIRNVAKESGILDTRLQGVGTQIYAFAKTSGMDSVTALNMMEGALRVAADSAAYYDRSLEDTADSLKSFLKGNYANDAALGVSATETSRNAAAMELYGKSFQNLSEAQKQLTLLQMVKDANTLSGAVGQAARESEGWENVIGNLKEAWNQLLAAVGKPILQGAVAVIKQLTEWITKLATWAQAASQALGELFGWDSSPTAQTAADTAQTAGSIAESVDNQNALTQAVAKTNAEVKRGIAGFDKLNIISKSTSGGSSGADTENSNAPAALGGNIVGSVDLDTNNADNKIKDIKEKFKKILEPFLAFYNKHIKPIYEKVKKKIDELRRVFADWWDKLNFNPLADSIDKVMSKIDPLVEVIVNQLGYVFENVLLPIGKKFIEDILPTMLNLIAGIIGFITPIIEGIGNILKPLWENILRPAFDRISEWFKKIVDEVKPKLEETGKKIGNALSKWEPIIRKISEVLGPVITKIIDFLGGSLGGALQAGLDSIGKIIDGIGGIADIIVGFAEGDNKKVTDGFQKLGEGILEALIAPFKHIWAAISGGLEGVGVDINGFFAGIWENITGFFSGVGEWFSGLWENIVTGWHTVFDPWIEIFKRAKSWINTTVIQPIGNFFSDVWNKISKGAGQAWEGIKKAFSPVADWFKNVFSNAWQGVKNVFSKGGEIFNGIKEGMFNTFKTVVNALIDGINTVIARTFEGLNNALRTIHDISILGVKPFEWIHTFDVPEIPKLASGGIVKAPTLAVVGDNPGAGSGNPEVIAPLNKLQSMINTSNGQDTVILSNILDMLTRIYEMFVIFRSQGGNVYEFAAQLNGNDLFREVVRQNELYKKSHRGRSAF